MVQRVSTVAFEGIEARSVDVQVQVAPGFPVFNVVGLPDKAVSEARERVRSALIASGLALPARRITVNLAPADLPKEGSHYDLPIALGLMAAKRRSSTGRAPNCCATPPRPCGCRRAATIACFGSRARLPTSMAPTRSAGCISPKPCHIARSPRTYETQPNATFTSPPDRVNTQVTSSVYAPQTISPCLWVEWVA